MLPPTPHAIVVIGVAGSGKTTVALALARHYGYVFLDADDFHSPEAKGQMAAGVPLTDAQREPWVGVLIDELRGCAQEGRSCVLAFSGLRAAHRQRLRECGVPVRFVFLHAAAGVIAGRLAGRDGHFMPVQLLDSQCEALEVPVGEPDVLSVDVDRSVDEVVGLVISALDEAPRQ